MGHFFVLICLLCYLPMKATSQNSLGIAFFPPGSEEEERGICSNLFLACMHWVIGAALNHLFTASCAHGFPTPSSCLMILAMWKYLPHGNQQRQQIWTPHSSSCLLNIFQHVTTCFIIILDQKVYLSTYLLLVLCKHGQKVLTSTLYVYIFLLTDLSLEDVKLGLRNQARKNYNVSGQDHLQLWHSVFNTLSPVVVPMGQDSCCLIDQVGIRYWEWVRCS